MIDEDRKNMTFLMNKLFPKPQPISPDGHVVIEELAIALEVPQTALAMDMCESGNVLAMEGS